MEDAAVGQESLLTVETAKIKLWYPNGAPEELATAEDRVRGGDWDLSARNGLAASDATSPATDQPLAVAISREGRFILLDDPDRLAAARLAGLQDVPVDVRVRHDEWVAFKDDIRSRARFGRGLIYQRIDHPDLIDIPATKAGNRARMLRDALADYDCAGKTLLDIGTNWGDMAQQMTKAGFSCTAIELDRGYAKIAKKISVATESNFEVWQGDFCEFPDPKADVTLALNIFHHPIKTEEGHAALVDFLERLETEIMFFQPHGPHDKKQMEGAYRDYAPREFAEFVAGHVGLPNIESIGIAEAEREVFKLTR
jgi:hypothetical protein